MPHKPSESSADLFETPTSLTNKVAVKINRRKVAIATILVLSPFYVSLILSS